MTVLATPTPYLRDGLRRLVAGLRKDAETVRMNLAEAEQDVAAARQLLAEAEAQHQRAKDAADALTREIEFFEREAARTAPAYDPGAALAATGLMPAEAAEREQAGREISRLRWGVAEPAQVPHPVKLADQPEHTGPVSATLYQDNGLPMIWDASVPPGGYVCAATDGDGICGRPVESEPCDRPHAHQYVAGIGDPRCLCGNLWPCGRDDDLTAPGVADSRAQIAPHLPPPVPHEPAGVPVATHGPTVTMPDTGLNPPPLPPASPSAEPRHAKPDRPGLLARLTGGHRTLPDEQDGDADA